tara:strand:+ start:1500 stop:2501 length:1002 start_codon:yes stop_codon:yes gene_type:complete
MKKFKFLLIPKSNNFREIININEISYQLKNLGHDCFTLKSQISDDNLNFILEEEKFDFVFRVNKGKPKNFNKKIRFISWVRQISDLNESLVYFNENDLIYTLKKTDKNQKLKINQLLPAANCFNNILKVEDYQLVTGRLESFQNIDISFLSNYSRVDLFNGSKGLITDSNKINSDKHKKLHKLLNNVDHQYNILIFSLINYSNLVTNKNIFYRGEINNFNYFFEIFKKSRFNLLFEDDLLSFNSNFFNILLVQGIVLADKKISKIFENPINNNFNASEFVFLFKTEVEISNIIKKYYENSNFRLKIGKDASKFVLKYHTYKNRVEQILKDIEE